MKGESPFLLPEKSVRWRGSVSTWVIPLLPWRRMGVSGTRFLSSSILREVWLHLSLPAQPFCVLCAMVGDLEGAQKPEDFAAFALRNLRGMKRVGFSPTGAERELWQGQLCFVQFWRQHREPDCSATPSLFVRTADVLRNAQTVFTGFVSGFQVCRKQKIRKASSQRGELHR